MVSEIYEARIDAGAFEAKAKAAAEAIPVSEQLATKQGLAEVKAVLKADIGDLKEEVFRALWIQGAGTVGLVVGLIQLL